MSSPDFRMVSTTTIIPLLLCLLSGRAEDGNQKDQNILNDNLLRAAGIFKAAQVTLKENVLALQQVFTNFNSLMGTMQTVSQSVSLTVREMQSSFVHHASEEKGNTCIQNLTLPVGTTCAKDKGMDSHREAFMSQLKSIHHTLQSSQMSLSEIKSDDILVRDCWDIYKTGKRQNGMYRIWPKLWKFIGSFYVYCDMENHNGGWTVLHRHHGKEDTETLDKTWNEYMFGFGDVASGGFWLGNEKICVLSQQREYQLMVTLWDKQNVSVWAKYNVFHVAQKNQLFKLHVGEYSGTAGDIMGPFNKCVFSTPDADHSKGKCAEINSSGWWFVDCSKRLSEETLRELNLPNKEASFWWLPLPRNNLRFTYSRIEMKIKPIRL